MCFLIYHILMQKCLNTILRLQIMKNIDTSVLTKQIINHTKETQWKLFHYIFFSCLFLNFLRPLTKKTSQGTQENTKILLYLPLDTRKNWWAKNLPTNVWVFKPSTNWRLPNTSEYEISPPKQDSGKKKLSSINQTEAVDPDRSVNREHVGKNVTATCQRRERRKSPPKPHEFFKSNLEVKRPKRLDVFSTLTTGVALGRIIIIAIAYAGIHKTAK